MNARIRWLSLCALACLGIVAVPSQNAQAQNLFVADFGSSNIYEFAPDGTRTTFATGIHPYGMAFNSVGHLFVGDTSSGDIYEFAQDGTWVTFASGFVEPIALAFDSMGNLFVGDGNSRKVVKITPTGTQSNFVSGLFPQGFVFDRTGDLLVAEWGDSTNIYEFSPSGVQSIFASVTWAWPVHSPPFPLALAFDDVGDLFVGNDTDPTQSIVEFTLSGGQSNFVSGLQSPVGLAFDSKGNLFAADEGSGTIYEFKPDGTKSTFASGLSRLGTLAFQPVPVLAEVNTNSTFQLNVTMPSPYYSTIIQYSSNMVSWVNVYTNTPPFTFTNSLTTSPSCFYRAVLGP
jgi:hypothetical protein